jgi:hypothetical protein
LPCSGPVENSGTVDPASAFIQVTEGVRHHAEALVRQVMAEPFAQDCLADRLSVPVATDDMALWLAITRGHIPIGNLEATFRTRAAAHRARGLSAEESLLLHQACVRVLNRSLSATAQSAAPRHVLERALGVATMAALQALNSTTVHEHLPAKGGGAEQAFGDQASSPAPVSRLTLPRWCVAAILPLDQLNASLRRFRAANPHALITAVGAHMKAFTHDSPAVAGTLGTYALIPVENGDTAGAARRASLAAVIARHYGVPSMPEKCFRLSPPSTCPPTSGRGLSPPASAPWARTHATSTCWTPWPRTSPTTSVSPKRPAVSMSTGTPSPIGCVPSVR